jgi:hypothetical protein
MKGAREDSTKMWPGRVPVDSLALCCHPFELADDEAGNRVIVLNYLAIAAAIAILCLVLVARRRAAAHNAQRSRRAT